MRSSRRSYPTISSPESSETNTKTERTRFRHAKKPYENSTQRGNPPQSAKSVITTARNPKPRKTVPRLHFTEDKAQIKQEYLFHVTKDPFCTDSMKKDVESRSSNYNHQTMGSDTNLFYRKGGVNDCSSNTEFTLETNVSNGRVLRNRKCSGASTNSSISMISLDGQDQKHSSGTDDPSTSGERKRRAPIRKRKHSGTSNSSISLNENDQNQSSDAESTLRRSKRKSLRSVPVKVKTEFPKSTCRSRSMREPKIPKLEYDEEDLDPEEDSYVREICPDTKLINSSLHSEINEIGHTFPSCECTKDSLVVQAPGSTNVTAGTSVSTGLCGARDVIGLARIGCFNSSKDRSLYRVSRSTAFRPLCSSHLDRQRSHQCCPLCGQFCSEGDEIMSCAGTSSAKPSNPNCHLFHKNCALLYALPPSTAKIKCPHCGEAESLCVRPVSVSSSETPMFFPNQMLSSKSFALRVLGICAKPEREEDEIFNAINDQTLSMLMPSLTRHDGDSMMMESNFPLSDELFINALENRELNYVYWHLSAGGDPNIAFPFREMKTPIHLAVESNDIILLHIICESEIEANLNAFDADGVTPLMLAAKLNNCAAINYLISTSADHLIQDNEGFTVIHHAVQAGSQQAVNTILDYDKSIVNISNNQGLTPLMLAAKMEFSDIANCISEYLEYERRAVLEIDNENNTSLHWVASLGCIKIALRLLEYGAFINAQNNRGETSLHVAIRSGQFQFAVCLLQKGADSTLIDKDGNTISDLCEVKDFGAGNQLDVTSRKGKEAVLFILTHMKIKSDARNSSFKRYSKSDISKGNENLRISCINIEDGQELPSFIYTTFVTPVRSYFGTIPCELPIHNCRCSLTHQREIQDSKACQPPTELFYDREGRLFQDTDGETVTRLYIVTECGSECPCDRRKCKNRVVQNGIQALLQVFHTPIVENKTKGWGLRTLTTIRSGNFICEYTGDLLSLAEMETLDDDSYLTQIFQNEENPLVGFVINSKLRGNVSRFVNHSCEANAVLVKVVVPHNSIPIPRIALFALRTILSNEEITLDYGKLFWDVKRERDNVFCLCKSSSCLYSSTETVEKINCESTNVKSIDRSER